MRRLPFLVLAFLLFFPAISIAKELPKIAVWDLIPGDIKATYALDLTSILVSEIGKLGKYEVYSQDNVRTLAGWTAERMALGCTDTKCLTALGQMDIARLISGRVGKIGNIFSVSLNLFDTQNARSENTISEFCRTEDELIVLVQQAVRKLLMVQVETSSFPAIPSDKSLPPPPGLPGASGSLEIKTKVQGAQVLVDGQNMGEAPLRISNLAPGPHDVQVAKKGYEEWKQRIQIQPSEKKAIEIALKRSAVGEDYIVDRVFYLENCYIGHNKFDYFLKFRQGGVIEGVSRDRANFEKPSREPKNFTILNGKWRMEKTMVSIDFSTIRGMPQRRVLKMQIDLEKYESEIFPAMVEYSTDGERRGRDWDGTVERHSCKMKEFELP